MDLLTKQKYLMRYNRPSELFKHLAYHQPTPNSPTLHLLEDNCIGFGFVAQPLCGCDGAVITRISQMLSYHWPVGTIIQFSLFGSPDVSGQINKYLDLHISDNDVLNNLVLNRAKYFEEASVGAIDSESHVRLRNHILLISLKVPVSSMPVSDGEMEDIINYSRATKAQLEGVGLYTQDMGKLTLSYIMQTLLNWDSDASWRSKNVADTYDEDVFVRENFFDLGSRIHRPDASTLKLGEKHLAVMSCKNPPQNFAMPMMNKLVGDIFGGDGGIKQNFLLTCNVHVGDFEKERAEMNTKLQRTNYSAYGSMPKWNPRILERKADMDGLYNSVEEGNKIGRVMLSCTVFCDSKEEVEVTQSALKSYWDGVEFRFFKDSYLALTIFLNQMPMNMDHLAVKELFRYKTMSTYQCAQFIPMVFEWTGGANPAVMLSSRLGQPIAFDLFDSDTSYSCVIAAESGAGKSFFNNHILSSYMAMQGSSGIPTKAWVIDIGESYRKQCEIVDGNFIDFADSSIVMNPFESITDYAESSDMIIGILSVMAAPNEGLTDHQLSNLRSVMMSLWGEYGTNLNIDIIAKALIAVEGDELSDVRKIGRQLFSFTTEGEFGRFFCGKSNIDLFSKQFTVLELKGLQNKKDLQRVVLFMVMYSITEAMRGLPQNVKKLICVDEGWQMLASNADVAKFLESAYRTWRKENGAAIICTQSINDLYGTASGIAIAENSPNKVFLKQNSTSIEQAKNKKQMTLDDYGFELLRTVRSVRGKYSEMFIMKDQAYGVARFVADKYMQLLYTTHGEEVFRLKKLESTGLTVDEAIKRYIELENEGRITSLDRSDGKAVKAA